MYPILFYLIKKGRDYVVEVVDVPRRAAVEFKKRGMWWNLAGLL